MIFVLAGAVMVALFLYGNRDGATKAPKPTNAKVGDCMHQLGITSAETVKCDDPNADFKVVGRVEGKYQFEWQSSLGGLCSPWPETTVTYWDGKPGQQGSVLCLASLK